MKALHDVPGLPRGVRRSARSPVPRAAQRVSRVRTVSSRCGTAAGIELARDDGALRAGGRSAIADGAIVAVKGLGGFQLMVDARNDDAVRRCARASTAKEKPFALMFPALADVERGVRRVRPGSAPA